MIKNKPDSPGEIHPEDRRNFIIFIVSVLAIWFAFDHYLLKPRLDVIKQAQTEAVTKVAGGIGDADLESSDVIRDRASILAEGARIDVDNSGLMGTLALKGNRIDDLSLKNYFKTLGGADHVVLLSPPGTEHPRYAEIGWLAAGSDVRVPDKDTVWRVENGTKVLNPQSPVVLSWTNPAGVRFERRISLDDSYMIRVTQTITNNSGQAVTLHPYALVSGSGLPEDYQGAAIVHEGPLGYIGEKLVEHTYRDMTKKQIHEVDATRGWIGITDKYWLNTVIPAGDTAAKFRFIYVPPATPGARERFQTDVMGQAVTVAAGASAAHDMLLFSGAKEVRVLDRYMKDMDIPHFDLAVDFGLYYFLTKPFFFILDFFGRLTGNFGVAILVLTIMVRIAVFPLANKTFKSFAKLKVIAPKMQELRERHASDREKLQQALVELYEKEKVNPMAGCLPMLVQIPIFFALYKILSVTIEMRHAPFFGWIKDLSDRDPTSLFNLFGLLPYDVPDFLMIGVWSCLMFVFMYLQKSMNPPPQDKTQAMMFNFMPYFITYILSSFSAGLVIYWTFSNALAIVQQYIIMRSSGVEVKFFQKQATGTKADDTAELALSTAEIAAAPPTGEPKQVTPPKPKKKKKK